MLKGIEKNNERNHRGKALVYLLIDQLLPLHRKHLKLFEEYRDQSLKIVTMDFSEFTDNEIEKVYIPELKKVMTSIL